MAHLKNISFNTYKYREFLCNGFCHCCTRIRPLYGWTGCCIIGQTQLLEGDRLDHHGDYS